MRRAQNSRGGAGRSGPSPSPRPCPAGRVRTAVGFSVRPGRNLQANGWLTLPLSQRERAAGIWPGARPATVAQISNLLDHRFPTCRALEGSSGAGKCERRADWKSAIQQIGNRRYVVCGHYPTAVERAGVRESAPNWPTVRHASRCEMQSDRGSVAPRLAWLAPINENR